ncbi:SDR family oxidoreductase [Bacillus pinisoli]|uniref:SDR family oxidoreductase n=1 Tax=Bacillus pinisoli TaxID=2901866 RepID=UPI001FF2E3B9|nr:SDR family oxidoreductase [Bacillus pinisoli]
MNILLTGATGFVGKKLTSALLDKGHHVYAIVRNLKKAESLISSVSPSLQKNLVILEGDVIYKNVGLSEDTVHFLKENIDTVYHVAAFLSFDENVREQTFAINLEGTRNVLELAKEIKVRNFFHVSTAYTLGQQLHAFETLHPVDNQFINPYEESKCYAEHLVFEYKDQFNVNIFRPSIIIGDSKTGEAETTFALYGVIRGLELIKRRMERKKDLQNRTFKFLCNQEVTQNFVPVDYVIDVLTAALLHAKKNTIYHITNSNPPTNQLIFELIQEYLDLPNVVMVPTDYPGQLSPEEQAFNQPMSVFYDYWTKDLQFSDANTRELLAEVGLEPLVMDRDILMRIIGKREQVLSRGAS